MTQHNGEPQPGGGLERVYALVGDGLEITYSQVSIPDAGTTESLIYQGPDGNHTFTGNTLRFQTSELGTLLTVTLLVSSTTFPRSPPLEMCSGRAVCGDDRLLLLLAS